MTAAVLYCLSACSHHVAGIPRTKLGITTAQGQAQAQGQDEVRLSLVFGNVFVFKYLRLSSTVAFQLYQAANDSATNYVPYLTKDDSEGETFYTLAARQVDSTCLGIYCIRSAITTHTEQDCEVV